MKISRATAISVKCPRCGAAPKQGCRVVNFHGQIHRVRAHAERLEKAQLHLSTMIRDAREGK